MDISNQGGSRDGRRPDQAAAEWVLRRERGLTAGEESEFARWLEADPRRAQAFAELDETSGLLDRLGHPSPAVTPEPWQGRPGHRAWILAGLGLAAGLAAAVLLWRTGPASGPAKPYEVALATASGDLRRVDLPDGSVVLLNSDSSVEVRYSAEARRVRLVRGEAFFTVAKNPARPFWAEAGGISVRAVGTAFNVLYRPDAVEVMVTEGKVRVADRTGHSVLPPASAATLEARPADALLTAGHEAKISVPAPASPGQSRATVVAVDSAAIAAVLGWREHKLEFSATPLSEVVAQFNLHNRHKLVIDDPVLARQCFGGGFAPHDYDALVEALEQGFGVVAEKRGDETVLRRAR